MPAQEARRCRSKRRASISTLPGIVSAVFFPVLLQSHRSNSFSPPCSSRRELLGQFQRSLASVATVGFVPSIHPDLASAASSSSSSSPPPASDDIQLLNEGSRALSSLLDNWERATVDCTYADVPRELLKQENKEELLEKASTFALFDKSTSVVSCKTSNRVVRDYIGVTGKGPLVGTEKRMRRLADIVDPDQLDDYFAETEEFSRALSGASALSWFAGHADFDSMNNFAKGEQQIKEDSNLEQGRRAIVSAKAALDNVIGYLPVQM